MNTQTRIAFIGPLIAICMVMVCSNTEKNKPPISALVVGDVRILNKNGEKLLNQEQNIHENDTIISSAGSKLKIGLCDDCFLYINSLTKILFGAVEQNGSEFLQKIYLQNGELFYTCKKQSGLKITYLVVTKKGIFSAPAGSYYVKYESKSGVLSAMNLNDSLLYVSISGDSLDIASCNGLYLSSDADKQIYPLTDLDVEAIKLWVGKSIINETISTSHCEPVVIEKSKNLPPEWTRFPSEVCFAGEVYSDTILANDPENQGISYELVSAPEGMDINRSTGHIKYHAGVTGNFVVHVKATDFDLNSTEYEYSLQVSENLAVRLFAPVMVQPDQPFTIRAAALNKNVSREKYTLCFDCDGDGVFETKGIAVVSGKFAEKNCVLKREGTFRISVEIKSQEGLKAVAFRKIIVNRVPAAVLEIKPKVGICGSEFLLDASGCSDPTDSLSKLLIRFDINGDGNWDLPANGGFLQEKIINYTWNKAGTYNVVAQVIDTHGFSDTASVVVLVTNGIPSLEIRAPDSCHVADSINFEAFVKTPEFPIVLYEWSFDNDSLYEVQSSISYVKRSFSKSGDLVVLCRVKDAKGQGTVQKKKISIINKKIGLDAGGPYKTGVNSTLSVRGIAEDNGSQIVGYHWDFDGDGKYDWSSAQNGIASFTFTHSGQKKIVFSVETKNGVNASDTAEVIVTNKAPIARAGEDIVSKVGRKVRLRGTGEDSDGKIILYEWDFDADGTVDYSSTENGVTEHEFNAYSTVVLSVTDSDHSKAFDSLIVVICPEDMVTVQNGKYCIDTYEYPNKKGVQPLLNVTYQEAVETCRKEGKHLCTVHEWENACKDSDDDNKYPYGKKFIEENCNTLGNPILKNRVGESGSFFPCKNSNGVYDMSGNAAEWVKSNEKMPVAYGGSWQNGEFDTKCSSKFQLEGGRKYFYVGFRCCK